MDKILLQRLYFDQGSGEDVDSDSTDPKEEYSKQLKGREGFVKNWWPWLGKVLCLDYVCCCFNKCCSRGKCGSNCWSRKLKSLRRYQAARMALHSEQDVLSILKVHRLSRFISKVLLTRKQRLTVPYSRKYVIAKEIDPDTKGQEFVEKALPFNAAGLCYGLNFDEDPWDERLLFELTGRKLDMVKYMDETSDDE